jgi:type IV pilus assembly protein PilN
VTTSTLTRLPDLPKVNLLPPEIGERKKLRMVQAGVALGVVAAMGGVGFLYVGAHAKVDAAKQSLASEQSQATTLQAKLKTLQDVKTIGAAADASEAMLTQAMAGEIKWSEYMADLSTTLPKSMWVSQLKLSESVTPGSMLTPNQSPDFAVGTVQMDGTALKYPALADLLDQLAKEQGLANVYFSQATESFIGNTKVVKFQSSADLDGLALSGRCAAKGSC